MLSLVKKVISSPKDVIILGTTDTGKSYFAFKFLKDLKKEGLSFGYLNSDVGQSQIGVPCVLSSDFFKKRIFKKMNPQIKIFFGDITPSSNIEWFLFCFLKLYKKSKKIMKNLIIDTTGFLKPKQAKILKLLKVNILEECYVICIGSKEEFKFLGNTGEKFFLFAHPQVKKKDIKKREDFRNTRFKKYFKEVKKIQLRCKGSKKELQKGRLIGFQDLEGFLKYLGIIDKVNKNFIEILVPKNFNFKKIKEIILGNIFLDIREGSHKRISSQKFWPQILKYEL